MLSSLFIQNFILIDRVNIEFHRGLCVLTGETGSGKSILIDSLMFVTGSRASIKLIKTGEESTVVAATFEVSDNERLISQLNELNITLEDNIIILKRSLDQEGRSKSFINDIPVSSTSIKNISNLLIEFNGQHDQKNLLDSSNYLNIVDDYANYQELLNQTKTQFHIYNTEKNKLLELQELSNKSKQEEDYLTYIVNELKQLAPREGEEEELSALRSIAANKKNLINMLQKSLNEISGQVNVEEHMLNAQKILMRSSNNDMDFSEIIDYLEKSIIEVREASNLLQEKLNDIELKEADIDKIEERLFELRGASRKFGCSCDELPNYLAELEKRLNFLLSAEVNLKQSSQDLTKYKQAYLNTARQLSQERKLAAKNLEHSILQELSLLKMEKTKFNIEFTELNETHYGARGLDSLNFILQTNPGSPPGSLNKIASGGELSRFMLSLKIVTAASLLTNTIIFDEIDTGISGAVADVVGKRLNALGKKAQIIVITHQPQVAARADYHYLVTKKQHNDITDTNVMLLDDQHRQEEIAKMIAGENVTNEARAAAFKLIELKTY